MDLPNGRDAPNGGVAADGEEKTRRGDRAEGSVENQHQHQQEKGEGLASAFITKLEALENGTESTEHLPEKVETSSSSKGEEAPELAAIARDLSKIKRQNTITHVLLATVIVMTAVWQVNEVSFLLWVQRKLSNPFKSLGDMIKGSLRLQGRRRPPVLMESSPLPPVGVPDITRTDLPTLVISGDHR